MQKRSRDRMINRASLAPGNENYCIRCFGPLRAILAEINGPGYESPSGYWVLDVAVLASKKANNMPQTGPFVLQHLAWNLHVLQQHRPGLFVKTDLPAMPIYRRGHHAAYITLDTSNRQFL